MITQQQIRQNLLAAREAAKLTQEEIAHKMGISRQTYINLEKGKTKIYNPKLTKASLICGVPEEKIILGYNPKKLSELQLHENDHQKEIMERMKAEYEKKIADRDYKIELLNRLVTSLSQTVKAKDDFILFLQQKKD